MRKLMAIIIILFTVFLHGDYREKAKKIYDFYQNTEYSDAAKIITAMTVLESAWYTSSYHNQYKNYYSKKISWKECQSKSKPIECMKQYSTFDEANIDMLEHFRGKGYLTSVDGFYSSLVKYRYAVDPEYVKKVKKVIVALQKRKVF